TLGRVETLDDAIGDVDSITTASGNNVIFGGAAGDTINLGDGTNLVFGDGGYIDWASDGNPADIDVAASTNPSIGGADHVTIGSGNAIVVGGAGADDIQGGTGTNIVLGDGGIITSAPYDGPQYGGLPITLGDIATLDDAIGP